jgi:hypothetical protein
LQAAYVRAAIIRKREGEGRMEGVEGGGDKNKKRKEEGKSTKRVVGEVGRAAVSLLCSLLPVLGLRVGDKQPITSARGVV